MSSSSLCYLVLQGRLLEDPIRQQEVDCFAHALGCDSSQFTALDLVRDRPAIEQVAAFDMILIGGSGEYSIAGEEDWVEGVLDTMRGIYDRRIPTFASCWGFQAMARALGGTVVTDPDYAELGTYPLQLTAQGLADPVFGSCLSPLLAQLGHQDIVTSLPTDAVLLASSELVENQAYCFTDRPIYCTQFHPELTHDHFIDHCRAYPQYVDQISELPLDEFIESVQDTPQARQLLQRFADHVLA
jgi:GMP synthase (glutamine-hydrolysing)